MLQLNSVRVACAWLVLLLLCALCADFLASDKPLYVRRGGESIWFANITNPLQLQGSTNESLERDLSPVLGDVLLTPPIPWGINQQDKGHAPLAPPSSRHWLGTDLSRRDVAARLIHGTRLALWVSVASVTLYVLIGLALGIWAGYTGGLIDAVISRCTESFMAVPAFFLFLAVVAVTEHNSAHTLVGTLALLFWPRIARLARADTKKLKRAGFIDAARALGYSGARIMFVHVLPNIMTPVIVAASFGLAGAVLVEAALSFLGFGVSEGTASWGGLLQQAVGNTEAWWLVVFPGVALFSLLSAYNALGEYARERLRGGV